MVDATPFNCINSECSTRPKMVAADGNNGVICPDCGEAHSVSSAIKPYARATGQWIIGGAVLSAIGWSSLEGLSGQIVGGIGALFATIAVVRIIRQAYLLKALGPRE